MPQGDLVCSQQIVKKRSRLLAWHTTPTGQNATRNYARGVIITHAGLARRERKEQGCDPSGTADHLKSLVAVEFVSCALCDPIYSFLSKPVEMSQFKRAIFGFLN